MCEGAQTAHGSRTKATSNKRELRDATVLSPQRPRRRHKEDTGTPSFLGRTQAALPSASQAKRKRKSRDPNRSTLKRTMNNMYNTNTNNNENNQNTSSSTNINNDNDNDSSDNNNRPKEESPHRHTGSLDQATVQRARGSQKEALAASTGPKSRT